MGLNSKRLEFVRRSAPLLGGAAMLCLVVVAAALGFAWSEQREFSRLDDAVAHQLDLYVAVLDIELGKQADLPGLIDADGEIDALLRAPEAPAMRASVNRRLTRFVARAGALSASVVDARGHVLASSDWYRPGSLMDHLVSNEPCVADALACAGGAIAPAPADDAAPRD
jgi:two-component system C4-dicarboxylate transport sensor histidine kinase DctB